MVARSPAPRSRSTAISSERLFELMQDLTPTRRGGAAPAAMLQMERIGVATIENADGG